MARTELTVQEIDVDGVAISGQMTAAIADGHKFLNDGDTYFYCYNGSGSSINLTFQTPSEVSGGVAIGEQVVAVAAGARTILGEFSRASFNQTDDMVYVDYSAITTVSVATFKHKNL